MSSLFESRQDRSSSQNVVGLAAAVASVGLFSLSFHYSNEQPGQTSQITAHSPVSDQPDLSQIVFDLAAVNSSVSIRNVMESLHEFSLMHPEKWPQQKVSKVMEEWALTTPYIWQTRDIALNWHVVSEERPTWVDAWSTQNVSGVALVLPDTDLMGIRVSYQLTPQQAKNLNQFQEMHILARVIEPNSDEKQTPDERWMILGMLPTADMQSATMSFPRLKSGQDVLITNEIYAFNDTESIGKLSRDVRYSIIPSADGSRLTATQRLASGQPISDDAISLAKTFEAVKSDEFIRNRATAAQSQDEATTKQTTRNTNHDEHISGLQIGNAAPELKFVAWKSVQLPNGAIADAGTYSFANNVTLLDFWAVWCGPCKISMPRLGELYVKYKDEGLNVISVTSTRETRDFADVDGIARRHIRHQVALGSPESFDSYQVTAYPTLVLVDKDGKVRWAGRGAGSEPPKDLLESLLRDLRETKHGSR